MAVDPLCRHLSKSQNPSSLFCKFRSLATLASPPHAPKSFINPYLGRPISSPTLTFGQLSRARASSLTVPCQNHPTIRAVIYPTSLLGGCFDLHTGETALVPIQGMNFPLLPLKITPEEREEDLNFALQRNGSSDVKDFMDSMGVGMFPLQSEELQEEELSVATPSLH